jgi:NDP-mannose synthase
MTKKAVILAGGKGTRLAPYTTVFPKPLMPLGETPILEIVLRQLARGGFTDVTLAVGHLAELIEAYFGDGAKVGVNLAYSYEDDPLGTAGPLANIAGLTDPFLVMNGDVLSTLDYGAFLEDHIASGAAASISTYTRCNKVDFGVVETDADDRVTDYVEKPSQDYLVSMGVYAFSPDVLSHVRAGERLDFPDLVLRLLAAGAFVRSKTFPGYWLDIGRHDDFERAQAEFADRRAEFLGEGA